LTGPIQFLKKNKKLVLQFQTVIAGFPLKLEMQNWRLKLSWVFSKKDLLKKVFGSKKYGVKQKNLVPTNLKKKTISVKKISVEKDICFKNFGVTKYFGH